MIGSVTDSPRQLLASAAEVTDLSGMRFRYRICVESCHGGLQQVTQEESRGRTAPSRGRPSTLPLYAPQVAQWLREDPDLSGADILRRVRLAGYRGGKSALYELVRRLRVRRPTEVTVAVESPRGSGSVQGITNR
jgi:hypothetical protein